MNLYRYLLEFPEEFGISPWLIRTEKPSYSDEKRRWESVKIKFVDIVGKEEKFQEFVRSFSHGLEPYNPPKDFDLTILKIDPVGVVAEKWVLKTCNVIDFNFKELFDRETFDLIAIFQPEYCIIDIH